MPHSSLFSWRQIDRICSYFCQKIGLTFHQVQIVPWEDNCMKCQSLFSVKKIRKLFQNICWIIYAAYKALNIESLASYVVQRRKMALTTYTNHVGPPDETGHWRSLKKQKQQKQKPSLIVCWRLQSWTENVVRCSHMAWPLLNRKLFVLFITLLAILLNSLRIANLKECNIPMLPFLLFLSNQLELYYHIWSIQWKKMGLTKCGQRSESSLITKTRLSNFDPLKPHFI